MPETVQTAVIADQIVFELERFELDGDRLELSGRWFGVRGRRFFRPTLTPVGARDRSRMLADLEHKPWAAEDGEPWEAAFPWTGGSRGGRYELSVAPDISIELPPPGARPGRPRRLTADSRRPAIGTEWRRPEPERGELSAPAILPPEIELDGVRAQLEAARRELKAAKEELQATRGELTERARELDSARADLRVAADEHLTATSATAAAVAARDRASADAERWRAEHDHVRSELERLAGDRDEVGTELGRLVQERDRLAAELALAQGTVTGLQSELQRARAALEHAARRRDEAITAHGAALVMRRAARAEPHYEPPAHWWRPVLAILALIALVFAILIVAHVL